MKRPASGHQAFMCPSRASAPPKSGIPGWTDLTGRSLWETMALHGPALRQGYGAMYGPAHRVGPVCLMFLGLGSPRQPQTEQALCLARARDLWGCRARSPRCLFLAPPTHRLFNVPVVNVRVDHRGAEARVS